MRPPGGMPTCRALDGLDPAGPWRAAAPRLPGLRRSCERRPRLPHRPAPGGAAEPRGPGRALRRSERRAWAPLAGTPAPPGPGGGAGAAAAPAMPPGA